MEKCGERCGRVYYGVSGEVCWGMRRSIGGGVGKCVGV